MNEVDARGASEKSRLRMSIFAEEKRGKRELFRRAPRALSAPFFVDLIPEIVIRGDRMADRILCPPDMFLAVHENQMALGRAEAA